MTVIKYLEHEIKGRGDQNGFTFEHLKTIESVHIYKKTSEEGDVSFEVFEIRFRNPHYECEYDYVESYPSSGEFGKSAFCVRSLDAAKRKAKILNMRIRCREAKRQNSKNE